MIKGVHNYSFRNRDLLDYKPLAPTENISDDAACTIDNSWEIVVEKTDSRLVKYFSCDLVRFLSESFDVFLRVRKVESIAEEILNPHKKIILAYESNGIDYSYGSEMQGAFHIEVNLNSVIIIGKSERGTAKGVYYVEDYMRLIGKPCLKEEYNEHAPLFAPRMTHSGIELDTYSDNYLEACAHAGMDAIIVFSGHDNMNLHGFDDPDGMWSDACRGYCDFNNLVWRAEGYVLDVYIYSHIICDMHPDDEGAEEYYEKSFGTFFKNHPGIKGIIFVGETFEFPSKDERTTGIRVRFRPKDDTRPSPGWFPCNDYPALLKRVQDTIYKYNKNVDIVFWTYNWGGTPKEDRLKLIESIPKNITLLVTFEMWDWFTDENGNKYKVDDYSISFPGPARVFLDEAEKAKELNIKLYSMANTGGKTWDIGPVPYLPCPQQWQKRYNGLRACNKEYNLSGLMECHDYGWVPSFLSLFTKNAFMTNAISDDEMLEAIAKRDYGSEYKKALEAWNYFSEGMSQVVAIGRDQYGPYRCGPTYPLLFDQTRDDLDIPTVPWARHKSGQIWFPIYRETVWGNPKSPVMRYERLSKVIQLFKKGLSILEDAAENLGVEYGSEVSRQIALVRFMYYTYITTSNVIGWQIAKKLLIAQKEVEVHEDADILYEAIGVKDKTIDALVKFMKDIATAETENTLMAVKCWEEDSIIGFEASEEYVFDNEFAEWKNNETKRSLQRLDAYLNN